MTRLSRYHSVSLVWMQDIVKWLNSDMRKYQDMEQNEGYLASIESIFAAQNHAFDSELFMTIVVGSLHTFLCTSWNTAEQAFASYLFFLYNGPHFLQGDRKPNAGQIHSPFSKQLKWARNDMTHPLSPFSGPGGPAATHPILLCVLYRCSNMYDEKLFLVAVMSKSTAKFS